MIIQPSFDPDCIKCGGSGDPDFFISSNPSPETCDCCCADIVDNGWFDETMAEIIPARFFGLQLEQALVTKFVIHCGSSSASTFGSYFQQPIETLGDGSKQWRRVSAHGAILDDGTWQQFVRYDTAAFHAAKYNYEAIGYELQGPPERNDWTPEMLAKLVQVIGYFMQLYPIEMICSHRSLAPLRKTDPGPNFPWVDLGSYFPTLQIIP
jgi:hypothetical protein